MPLAGVLSLGEFVNEGIVRYYNGGWSIYGHCRDVKVAPLTVKPHKGQTRICPTARPCGKFP
jgi:hypothetical protein